MSTPPRPSFSIKAKFLGPILDLNGELSSRAQNLIFARNGTGKSFLSRAFRYLYLNSRGLDISEAPNALVSDESPEQSGEFHFSQGDQPLGQLQLNKRAETVKAQSEDTIFHVFSDEFVHEELRTKRYELDGKTENVIAVDSENIKITQAREAIEEVARKEGKVRKELLEKFNAEKIDNLNDKASVNKLLTEYKELNLEKVIDSTLSKPNQSEKPFREILDSLDKLKSLPADPTYPKNVITGSLEWVDVGALTESLKKETSPSSIADSVKAKIDAHHGFYETGISIIQDSKRTTCPLCEQSILSNDPKAVIDSYLKYFADEEEKHKSELRGYWSSLNGAKNALSRIQQDILKQKNAFDSLKGFLPTKKDIEVNDAESEMEALNKAISSIQDVIQNKTGALSDPYEFPNEKLGKLQKALVDQVDANNAKVADLNSSVEQSDKERRALQRKACTVFLNDFIVENWAEIEDIRLLKKDLKNKESEFDTLEKSNPSTSARPRVAETFELLLKEFFGNKYSFDKDRFVLTRGEREMDRGVHRTLSDGEKTAVAFCYFVASIHRNVSSNNDYAKLYLVFDDPVTSMSYDFVFAITQTLKNLNISTRGDVSVNPGNIGQNGYLRPRLLVLTHSTYFFNIAFANGVVNENAAFSLYLDGEQHKLSRMGKYLAPFHQQLREICRVAEGTEPDHTTGNAIRSVLEAVGRFCRPDKTDSLSNFITFLAREEEICLKSVLINSLSHGSFYEETPSPEDLRMACQDIIVVVEHFAKGQLELIRAT